MKRWWEGAGPVLKTVDITADTLVKIVAIGGIAFTALTYSHNLDNEKIARVTSYIDRYETGDTSKSVRRISSALREFSSRSDYRILMPIVGDSPKSADAAHEAFWQLLINNSANGKEFSNDLDDVVGFYSSLQTCVSAALCDRKVAHAFFDEPADTFFQNFDGYIKDRRKTDAEFALGLERFTQDSAKRRAP
jgi:hypothetical protein